MGGYSGVFLCYFSLGKKSNQKFKAIAEGIVIIFSLGDPLLADSMRSSVQGGRVILMNRRFEESFMVRASGVRLCFVL
jgi:hypothetical protein